MEGARDGLVLVGLEAKGPEVYIYRRLLGALPLVLCARMRNASHASQREATSRQLCVMQGRLGMLMMRSNNVAGRHTHTHTHTHTHIYGEAIGGCALMLVRAIERGACVGGDRGIAGPKTGPLSWWRHGGLEQLLDYIP